MRRFIFHSLCSLHPVKMTTLLIWKWSLIHHFFRGLLLQTRSSDCRKQRIFYKNPRHCIKGESLKFITTAGIQENCHHQQSLKDFVDIIPDTKMDDKGKGEVLRDKKTDKDFSFFDSKVHSAVCCYSWHAHHWIYSHIAVGFTEGPSRDHINKIKRWV